ncbi:MAG TPA: GSU2403 family nucleotidyltransferase fold protein [Patescibacteria group bacterium]|nr:GSU2403 family nucleotidyltransferase fold protein [Patescibacteria group bacterium]
MPTDSPWAILCLPAPARYAVHKLLVIAERSGAYRAKIGKDVAQAASLIEYFANTDLDPLMAAWQDARERGPGWRKRADEGLRALRATAPDQAALLAAEK